MLTELGWAWTSTPGPARSSSSLQLLRMNTRSGISRDCECQAREKLPNIKPGFGCSSGFRIVGVQLQKYSSTGKSDGQDKPVLEYIIIRFTPEFFGAGLLFCTLWVTLPVAGFVLHYHLWRQGACAELLFTNYTRRTGSQKTASKFLLRFLL